MKVTIDKTEKVEIEVQLPLFTKNNTAYYKIEENKTTQICIWTNEINIKIVDWAMEYPCGYEQVTENEFNEVVNRLKEFI